MSMSTTALLVIDAQEGYFNGKATFLDNPQPLFNIDSAQENVVQMLEKARKMNYPVVFIAHEGLELGALHASMTQQEQDIHILKTHPSSFFGTDLHEKLQGLGIEKLILCGYQTDVCIKATALDALKLHYLVTVVEDAVSAQTEARHVDTLHHLDLAVARVTIGHDIALA